jgi:hypothetical protein
MTAVRDARIADPDLDPREGRDRTCGFLAGSPQKSVSQVIAVMPREQRDIPDRERVPRARKARLAYRLISGTSKGARPRLADAFELIMGAVRETDGASG